MSPLKPVQFLAVGAALVASAWAHDANAYKEGTHQDVVDHAWEIMLAAQDPALTTGRGLFLDRSTAPQSLRETPTNLAPPIDAAAWARFMQDIRETILKLNRMPSGIEPSTNARCGDLSPGVTLGRITTRIDQDYRGTSRVFAGDDNGAPNRCRVRTGDRFGIYARVGSSLGVPRICADADPNTCEPLGTPSAFCEDSDGDPLTPCVDFGGLRGDFGDTIAQGLILGWHAKAGDDCVGDIDLDTNLAQAAVHWPLPWLGGASMSDVGGVIGFGLAILLAPFICIDAAISGDNCLEQVLRAANDLNLATLLASAFPGMDAGNQGRTYSGLPHFINAQGPGVLGLQTEDTYGFQNEWDDRRGMWYSYAGPDYFPGVVDRGIRWYLDITGLVIDPDEARMVERYNLGFESDGHPPSRARSKWSFAREPLGHIPLTPGDNFAYFGWTRFEGNDNPTRDVKYLRWPLHMLGDATVPMHVVTTSGYGHQPYEQVVQDFVRRFRDFSGELNPEIEQLEQARRILHMAFGVRREIQGGPGRIPIRDLVTDLARETLATANSDGGWAWCETCSMSWSFGGDTEDSKDYYAHNATYRDRMRGLYERAVANTLAFLMSASEVPISTPSCVEVGQPCSVNNDCCVGACTGGTCGGATGPTGPGTCTTNQDCPQMQPCVNGHCQGCTDCVRDEHCGTGGRCVNGCCNTGPCGASGACAPMATCRSADCAGGMCDTSTGTCCSEDFQACTAQTNCCSGVCDIAPGQTTGSCRRSGSLGTDCTQDSDCAPLGTCQNGTCACGGGGDGCMAGSACCSQMCVAQPGTTIGECTGIGDPGDPCTTNAECRNGRCGANCTGLCGLSGCVAPQACLNSECCDPVCDNTCTQASECPNGQCIQGTCCLNENVKCLRNEDCCSTNCEADGFCRAVVR